MREGAVKSKLKGRKDDLYETPPEATRALIAVEPLPLVIWEPCAGRGAIVRELRKAGHAVFASDLVEYEYELTAPGIESRVDFLMTTYRDVPRVQPYHPAPTIVTNPPFKLADQFIRHGLELGCRVIVLQRLMALEGVGRSDLIDNHLVRVWIGRERLPMMHKDGWEGNKTKQETRPFAWFVFQPTAHSASRGFTARRMSWYGPATPAVRFKGDELPRQNELVV